MTNEYDCEYRLDEGVTGNTLDLDLNKCDSEVRADVLVAKNKRNCVRVYGQVKDCDGKPIKDALVKLLKSYYFHGKVEFEGVAHTVTDCLGFYQFDVCVKDEHDRFRILVSKATTGGKERVIHDKGCNPCENNRDDCDC